MDSQQDASPAPFSCHGRPARPGRDRRRSAARGSDRSRSAPTRRRTRRRRAARAGGRSPSRGARARRDRGQAGRHADRPAGARGPWAAGSARRRRRDRPPPPGARPPPGPRALPLPLKRCRPRARRLRHRARSGPADHRGRARGRRLHRLRRGDRAGAASHARRGRDHVELLRGHGTRLGAACAGHGADTRLLEQPRLPARHPGGGPLRGDVRALARPRRRADRPWPGALCGARAGRQAPPDLALHRARRHGRLVRRERRLGEAVAAPHPARCGAHLLGLRHAPPPHPRLQPHAPGGGFRRAHWHAGLRRGRRPRRRHRQPRRLRHHGRDRPHRRHRHALCPPLRDPARAQARLSRPPGPGDRPRRLDRARHRPAPAFRGAPQRHADQPGRGADDAAAASLRPCARGVPARARARRTPIRPACARSRDRG